jgi:glyoxylase-like metal-dependent hydrolase (beta-lactamase superfamily II)
MTALLLKEMNSNGKRSGILRLVLLPLSLCGLLAVTQEEDLFELVKVKDGIYAALAKPQYKLNCNAAVIINEDDVLIVDSHSKPSAAQALLKQIRKITPNRVRYVVNTHFHYDHARGNQAYFSGFPNEVTLISSEQTRKDLIGIETSRLKQEVGDLPGTIAKLEQDFERESDSKRKLELGNTLVQARTYQQELKSVELVLPGVTFDRSMILHKKNREIVLLFLGRGHTAGDIVVYLPRERVLATGDLVTSWVPGMNDGYPNEWIGTLGEISKLNIESVIVGHGAIAGKRVVEVQQRFLSEFINAVKVQVQKGSTLQETQTSVVAQLAPRYASEFPALDLERRIGGNVPKVYAEVKAGLY